MKYTEKKTIIFLIFCILIIGANSAKAQSVLENNEYNSVFWEISGNGLEKPSYLLGTIHLIPKADYVFTEIMQEKFNTCKVLVLEADINMSIKAQIAVVKKIMLPKDKPLNKYMTGEQFSEFKSYLLDTLKIKKSKFKKIIKLKPYFSLALILSDLMDKPTAYENELSKEAKERKMQIHGLETIDFQLSIFDKISVEEQVESLVKENNGESPLSSYNKMLTLYKEGSLTKLLELSRMDTSFQKYEEEFLTNRNADWIPKIEEIVKKEPAFIAVGSDHLPDETGVITLLRKQGYTVKPLM